MWRSRKPLYVQAYRGFESLSLRHLFKVNVNQLISTLTDFFALKNVPILCWQLHAIQCYSDIEIEFLAIYSAV